MELFMELSGESGRLYGGRGRSIWRMSNDVDDYLAALPDETRPALEQLRKSTRAAAPKATEKISYQIPTFEYLGPLVAYAAFKRHCGLYVMSSAVIEAHQEELAPTTPRRRRPRSASRPIGRFRPRSSESS
jgi:hypothetical protein